MPYVICRPFNAYGPGERADDEPGIAHVIPDLIEKVMDGVYPLPIFGSGVQTRCFTYVEDVAEGICRAGLDPRGVNEDFNIGVNVPASIAELAEKIWKYCGRREEFKLEHLEPQLHDIQVRVPDTSKAARMLDRERGVCRAELVVLELLDQTLLGERGVIQVALGLLDCVGHRPQRDPDRLLSTLGDATIDLLDDCGRREKLFEATRLAHSAS